MNAISQQKITRSYFAHLLCQTDNSGSDGLFWGSAFPFDALPATDRNWPTCFAHR